MTQRPALATTALVVLACGALIVTLSTGIRAAFGVFLKPISRTQPRERCGNTTVKNCNGVKVTLDWRSGKPGKVAVETISPPLLTFAPRDVYEPASRRAGSFAPRDE